MDDRLREVESKVARAFEERGRLADQVIEELERRQERRRDAITEARRLRRFLRGDEN